MGRILSDEEMQALEAAQPKKGLSDEEMSALEAQHAAQPGSPDKGSPSLLQGIAQVAFPAYGAYRTGQNVSDAVAQGQGLASTAGQAIRTLGEQAADHATLGHYPQIEGGIRSLGGADYAKARDAAASRMGEDASAFPAWANTGAVGGATAQAAAFGGATNAATEALGLVRPAATALGAVGKAAGRVGLNAGMGAAQGYATNPGEGGDRASNALKGGLTAGGLSAAGEVLGAVTAPAARIKENLTAQKDREGFAKFARDKLEETRQGLLESEKGNASKLEELLRGKPVPVNGTEMEGNELNDLKKMYDKQAKRPPGAMWSTGEAAKAAEAGAQADQARAAIEAAEPGAKPLNAEMQRELKLRSFLKKGADRAPIGTLTTPSADKQALLAEAARRGGTKLDRFASDSRVAKSLTFRPSDLSHMGMGTGIKALGRAGLELGALGNAPANLIKDPVALSALLSRLNTPTTKK